MININMDGVLGLPSVPFQHKDFLPDTSGLYFVVTYSETPRLVYIGQAQNIAGRWTNHHREPELNLLRKLDLPVDIFWLELRVSFDILDEWERKLIKQLNPAINDSLTMATEAKRLEKEINPDPVAALPELSAVSFLQKDKETEYECVPAEDEELFFYVCPECGSDNTSPHGKTRAGTPRKRCTDCGKTWTPSGFTKHQGRTNKKSHIRRRWTRA